MKTKISKLLSILLISVLINSGCVSLQVSPVSGNKRVYGYSWEKEKQIGAEADGEIIAQYGLYDDQELADYVNRLGQELLAVSHFNRADTPTEYQNTPFTFRVLNSPVVNAFALPGGYVYVTRGLLAHLENEAQLMVVLGHEIGHVAARHASQRAAEQQLGQLAIIGGVVGQSFGLDGGSILQLSSQTAQLLFLSYGRDDERESDKLGVEYSAIEGYVAAEGGEFFTSLKRISEKAGHSIPSHLSSHPDPGERELNIPKMAEGWAEQGYPMTKINRDEFLNKIDGIMYGENPRDGFEENDMFYHPELEFQFPVPDGFAVINQPSAVILVNEAQDAVVQFSIDSENTTAEASVKAFLAQDGISVVEQEDVNVNGYTGYSAEASTQTEDGNTFTLDISAVSYNGNVYRFLSYTSANQFNEYRGRFSSVSVGFDALSDKNILSIEPVRLQLTRARETTIFSNLLPKNMPMGIEAEDLAIINQVSLDERISRGTIVKIPVQ